LTCNRENDDDDLELHWSWEGEQEQEDRRFGLVQREAERGLLIDAEKGLTAEDKARVREAMACSLPLLKMG
jgi:hypothetical protein